MKRGDVPLAEFTHPEYAMLFDPLFAARKEGEKGKKAPLYRLRKRGWSIRWLAEYDRVSKLCDLPSPASFLFLIYA